MKTTDLKDTKSGAKSATADKKTTAKASTTKSTAKNAKK